jgi:hypothetical protein
MRYCLIIFIPFVLCLNSSAQRLAFRKNLHRAVYYYVGDVISYRIKGDDVKYTDRIAGFEDSVIVLQDFYKLHPAEISYLYVDGKTGAWFGIRYRCQQLFMRAGLMILGLDVINSRQLKKETLVFSGELVLASLIIKAITPKKFKIAGKRRLFITN